MSSLESLVEAGVFSQVEVRELLGRFTVDLSPREPKGKSPKGSRFKVVIRPLMLLTII